MPPAVRTIDPLADKRPKLERAQSAVEKENVPLLQRGNSLLNRQFSYQEQVGILEYFYLIGYTK